MRLSYLGWNTVDEERVYVDAEITTEHPASSYGQPVIVVLEDGGALDLTSWVVLDYQVEDCTADELELLIGIFGNIHVGTER